MTAPPGDRRRVFVVEQGGRIRVVRRRASCAGRSSTSREGHRGRRAGPALDRLRARLRARRGASTSTSRTRAGDTRIVEYRVGRPRARRRRQRALRPAHRPAERQPQRRPARCSDPTACSTSAPATAAAAATRAQQRARTSDTLLGKILRIDPRRHGGRPYGVPRRQPVRRPPRARREIFALRAAQPVALLVRPRPAT